MTPRAWAAASPSASGSRPRPLAAGEVRLPEPLRRLLPAAAPTQCTAPLVLADVVDGEDVRMVEAPVARASRSKRAILTDPGRGHSSVFTATSRSSRDRAPARPRPSRPRRSGQRSDSARWSARSHHTPHAGATGQCRSDRVAASIDQRAGSCNSAGPLRLARRSPAGRRGGRQDAAAPVGGCTRERRAAPSPWAGRAPDQQLVAEERFESRIASEFARTSARRAAAADRLRERRRHPTPPPPGSRTGRGGA